MAARVAQSIGLPCLLVFLSLGLALGEAGVGIKRGLAQALGLSALVLILAEGGLTTSFELTAAAGLGGRPRRLGSEAERARLNVTRAIRSAISRIHDHAPDAAAHLNQTIRTGSRCSYSHTRTEHA